MLERESCELLKRFSFSFFFLLFFFFFFFLHSTIKYFAASVQFYFVAICFFWEITGRIDLQYCEHVRLWYLMWQSHSKRKITLRVSSETVRTSFLAWELQFLEIYNNLVMSEFSCLVRYFHLGIFVQVCNFFVWKYNGENLLFFVWKLNRERLPEHSRYYGQAFFSFFKVRNSVLKKKWKRKNIEKFCTMVKTL